MPNPSSESHFDTAVLQRFCCAELTGEERQRVAAHVSGCEYCASICRRYDKALSRVFTDLEEFAPAEAKQDQTLATSGAAVSAPTWRKPLWGKFAFLPSWVPQRLAYAAVLVLFVGAGGVLLLFIIPREAGTTVRDAAGKFKLSRSGRLSVPSSIVLTADWKSRIQSALDTGRPPELPAIDAVLQPLRSQSALLGSSRTESLALLSPVNSAVLLGRIAFRWTAVPGAEGYLLRLQGSGGFQWQTNVSSATNFVFNAAQVLQPGRTYEWSVEARVNARGHVARPRQFYALDEAASAEVRRLQSELRSSSLALGLVYAAHGMLDDAQGEFERLLLQNPENPSVKLWLETLARRRQATQ